MPHRALVDPFEFDPVFYQEHDYHVEVEIAMRHDRLTGNVGTAPYMPNKIVEGPGRFYVVTYRPESAFFRTGDPELFGVGVAYRQGLHYWLLPEKEKFNSDAFSMGFVLVRRAYQRAVDALGRSAIENRDTFELGDVLKAFPWISNQLINNRIQRGHLRIRERSAGRGLPHIFSLPELVHAAILDEVAAFGALIDLRRFNVVVQW